MFFVNPFFNMDQFPCSARKARRWPGVCFVASAPALLRLSKTRSKLHENCPFLQCKLRYSCVNAGCDPNSSIFFIAMAVRCTIMKACGRIDDVVTQNEPSLPIKKHWGFLINLLDERYMSRLVLSRLSARSQWTKHCDRPCCPEMTPLGNPTSSARPPGKEEDEGMCHFLTPPACLACRRLHWAGRRMDRI